MAVALVLAAAVPASAEEVSNESTRSVPAYVKESTWVRNAPDAGARRLARLRTRTYHGSREVVVVLRRDETGKWSFVRYAGLGNRVGWVPSKNISPHGTIKTQLVIDRKRTRVTLYRSGKSIFSARVGVGAKGSPTPAGRFYVREALWTTNPGGTYGPIAFGLSAFSKHRTSWAGGGQVGLHGTNHPGLIPGRISNGCIRMRNRAIRRLERLMPVGTPIEIR